MKNSNRRKSKDDNGKARDATRASTEGDTSPSVTPEGIEDFTVSESIEAARQAKINAVRDIIDKPPHDVDTLARVLQAIMDGTSNDDARVIRAALMANPDIPVTGAALPDDTLASDWRMGGYPYKNLMSRKGYEKQKYRLQVELLKLQSWVKEDRAKGRSPLRGAGRGWQRRNDQEIHGTLKSSRRESRCVGEADRRRERPMVLPTLYETPSDVR